MKAPASTIIIMGLVLFTRDNFTNTQQTTVKNWLNTNKNVMANEGRGKQRSTNGKPWEQKTKKKKWEMWKTQNILLKSPEYLDESHTMKGSVHEILYIKITCDLDLR